MKPIENVAIVGFGSLGAMYAACFGAAMGPERVFVVADAARTERYRAEAATFNGEPIRVTYLTYEEAAERAAVQPFDVVLYAVKYGALPEAIEQSSPLVSLDTAVISVLNGITSEEVLAERFGWDRVLLCIAQQMDSRKVGAVVTAGCVGVMALGVRDARGCGPTGEPRSCHGMARRRRAALHRARDDIQHQLWGKLICNVGVNQACAVYDCCFNGIHVTRRGARGHDRRHGGGGRRGPGLTASRLTDDDVAYWLDIIDHLNPAGHAEPAPGRAGAPSHRGGALLGHHQPPGRGPWHPHAAKRALLRRHQGTRKLLLVGANLGSPSSSTLISPERGDQGRPLRIQPAGIPRPFQVHRRVTFS